MTKYQFSMPCPPFLDLEGWVDFDFVQHYGDVEPQGVTINSVEINTDLVRDRQIQRGEPVRDNLPDTRLGDEYMRLLIEHLQGDAWEDAIDVAVRQDDLNGPDYWQGYGS